MSCSMILDSAVDVDVVACVVVLPFIWMHCQRPFQGYSILLFTKSELNSDIGPHLL